MRSVKGTIAADALSELLQRIRFRSTLMCRSELNAPWGFAVEGREFASFHVVLRGRCVVEVDGLDSMLSLERGDAVILPHGDRHVVRDAPSSPVTRLEQLVAECPLDARGVLERPGPGARTVLVCGGFQFERDKEDQVFSALPPALRVRALGPGASRWLGTLLRFLTEEALLDRAGADVIVTRLADVLFVEAIRRYLASPEAAEAGVAIAIRDRRIATALASILQKPEAEWRVETLARRAGMSRTAFATRFSELIGESPLRYVAQCRMKRAAALLQAGAATIPQIAERVGYESDVGFSRAFKRHMGSSPAIYRRAVAR